jgi:hypothetical protein
MTDPARAIHIPPSVIANRFATANPSGITTGNPDSIDGTKNHQLAKLTGKRGFPLHLTKLWLGHSKQTVTDVYASGLEKDEEWRRE